MNEQNVLITGGLGFIGSVVAEQLLNRGCHVTLVDSLLSNVVAPEHFTSRFPAARVEVTTAAEFFEQKHALRGHDRVIHAASLVGPAGILPFSGNIAPQIVATTARAIQACIAANVPMLYISSAEVYGHSGLLSEDSYIRVPPRFNARIEYALGKLASEAMIVNSAARGLRAVIIRPFNVVGPRQRRSGGFVVPTFVQQALVGEPITVFSSGLQRRAFVAVEDVSRFILEHVDDALASGHPVFNVGNPRNTVSIIDVARRIKSLLSSRSEIVLTDGQAVHGLGYFESESIDKLPAVTAASDLGWQPRKTFDEIILATADFYGAQTQTERHGDRIAAL